MDKLCRIRDLQRAVNQFEAAFEKRYGIELCCKDRRQMHYSLTTKGRELLASVSCREIEIPEILRKWLCG